MSTPRRISPNRLAEMSGFSADIIRGMCSRGDLPANRFGTRWHIDAGEALAILRATGPDQPGRVGTMDAPAVASDTPATCLGDGSDGDSSAPGARGPSVPTSTSPGPFQSDFAGALAAPTRPFGPITKRAGEGTVEFFSALAHDSSCGENTSKYEGLTHALPRATVEDSGCLARPASPEVLVARATVAPAGVAPCVRRRPPLHVDAEPPSPAAETLLTADDLARHVHLAPRTIRRKALRGQLPCIRPGREPLFVLSEVIDSLKTANERNNVNGGANEHFGAQKRPLHSSDLQGQSLGRPGDAVLQTGRRAGQSPRAASAVQDRGGRVGSPPKGPQGSDEARFDARVALGEQSGRADPDQLHRISELLRKTVSPLVQGDASKNRRPNPASAGKLPAGRGGGSGGGGSK